MKKVLLALLVTLFVVCFSACSATSVSYNDVVLDSKYNPEEITKIQHEPISENGATKAVIYATSESSEQQSQYDENIVLKDSDEPVYFSIQQTGKNRKMRLLVYVDYIKQSYAVGAGSEYVDYYDFEIKDNEEIIIPLYFQFSNIDRQKSHRMIFVLIPSIDEYAKDKKQVSYNPVFTTMKQLFFEKYDDNMPCEEPDSVTINQNTSYYDINGINIILNTDISNIKNDTFEGLYLPEKHYLVEKNSKFDMYCAISNLSEPQRYALVFLTLDNKPIQIENKDYILVDLKNEPMSILELSVNLPDEIGIYDVMGYVVYNPFEPLTNGESFFVYTSPRFSVETNWLLKGNK